MSQPTIEAPISAVPETSTVAEPWTKRFGTDAVLLACLTGLGYWIAFAYESGYATHFGYPNYVISPTIGVIVTAIGTLALSLAALAPMIMDMTKPGDAKARRLAYNYLLLVIFFAAALYTFYVSNYDWKALWKLVPGLVLFFALRWTTKLDADKGRFPHPKASLVFLVLSAALLLNFLANLLGLVAAQNQKVFYFLADKPDFAVVRIYDGLVIGVRFDAAKQQFLGEYTIVKLGEDLKTLQLKRVALKDPRLPVMKNGEP